jgi:hypothetical protein
MTAWKTVRKNARRRHEIGPRPCEAELEKRIQDDAAHHRDQDQPGGRALAHEEQISHHGSKDDAENRETAERGEVARTFLQPSRPDRLGWIGRIA